MGLDGIKNAITKGGRDKVCIGFDLTDEFSQLSISVGGEEPQTPSLIAGVDRLCIPTLLAKRYAHVPQHRP